jgi:hypothetical protein
MNITIFGTRASVAPLPQRMVWRALSLAACLAAAGASAGVEDRRWCRVTNEHFELVTDLGRAKAASLFYSLDRFRAAASALVPGRPPEQPAPLKMLVFKRARDFDAVFRMPGVGGFMRPTLNQSLLALGPDRSGRHLHAIAFHEYTHYLVRSRATLNLPIWYEEGLATYLAMLEVDPFGVVTVGRGPHAMMRYMVKQPETPIEELIGERYQFAARNHHLAEVYTLAWGLVRFLHHAKRDGDGRYAEGVGSMLAAVNDGASSAHAMQSEVGIELGALRSLMRDYYDGAPQNVQSVFKFRMGAYAAPPFAPDCLDRIDRRQVIADAVAFRDPAQAAALYEAILRREREHIGALLGRSRVAADPAVSLAAAQKAFALAPNDPDVNVRMAQISMAPCDQAAEPDCERDWDTAAAYYARALEASDLAADAALGLGVLHLRSNEPEQALGHLRKAHGRAPWSPRISYYLGLAHQLAGDFDLARRHLRKTAYWDPDEVWRERALDALAKLPLGMDAAQ